MVHFACVRENMHVTNHARKGGKMSFAENLAGLRKFKGMSQEELAAAIGVSRQTLSKYETGESVPDIERTQAIAAAFGVSRAEAAAAISRGLVSLDHYEVTKADKRVEPGSTIVLRGKGKAYLREVGGRTRKDRIFVAIEKFI